MARPGKLNVTGAPGVPDFTLDYFIKTRGLKVQKIPFKNIVEAATALAGNQIDFLLTSAAIVRPLASAGKIRILAVTSRERASFAPTSRPCTNSASAGSRSRPPPASTVRRTCRSNCAKKSPAT